MKVLIGPLIRTLIFGPVCRRSIVGVVCLLAVLTGSGVAQQAAKRPFTVADDVALSHFGSRISWDDDPFVFSPDHRFFAVYTEHGRLDLNRPESILRVYRTEVIIRILKEQPATKEPSPLWEISKSTYRHGPIVTRMRWLRDSSGVAFLAKTASGNNQLLLADLRTKTVHQLTGDDQQVISFDIRTQHNFVYTALTPPPPKPAPSIGPSAIIGTGKDLFSLMFPEESGGPENSERSELWAVVSGRRFKLKDPASGRSLTIYSEELSLAPDGQSVVTALPVDVVPAAWEKLYPPPPLPWGSFRVQAGPQDLQNPHGFGFVEEYVLIDLPSGKIQSLLGAPTAMSAAWWASPSADWSSDGQSVALSGAFLRQVSPETNSIRQPCVAVLEIRSRHGTCLESVYGTAEDDKLKSHITVRVRFVPDSDTRVTIDALWEGSQIRSTTYTRESGNWKQDTPGTDENKQRPFGLSIKQSLNDPPVLVATDNSAGVSRVIWDPNPQLRDIALGEVSVFRWKDPSGRDDVGGLFKPPDYVPSRRYPLVIQTHGFVEDQFIPSGAFPTAFAAQELAARGMLVLQIRGEACPFDVPEEAPCIVADYEAAANELIKAGLVDPDKLGIIGFSRTGYYVLEELTAGTLHFKAAAITDSADYSYLQYLYGLDSVGNAFAKEADTIIGAPPFAEGLTQWLKRSPGFKMDRVETPLQVVALDHHTSLMDMWEPYATLRYLRKPVDLIVIPDSEHVMTNPGERMISQGGTVDWFRFWLKGEEDPDPTKADQYERWRELRHGETQTIRSSLPALR
jgi:dipeptidyl aminopeptidase/acylaminoacyl peptidase